MGTIDHRNLCCGPVRYLLDNCDGAVPWKCYWRVRSPLSGSVNYGRPSGWTMTGSRMETYKYATSPDEYEMVLIKLKPKAPPWTIEYSVRLRNIAAFVSGSTTQRHAYINLNSRFRVQVGTGLSSYDRWNVTYVGLGTGSYTTNGRTVTTDFDYVDTTVNLQLSMDASYVLTYNLKFNGNVVTYDTSQAATNNPWLPGGTSTMTAGDVATRFTNLAYWPLSLWMQRGGQYEHIEVKVS